ncbi:DUF3558 domain-containing protein [Nocardia cyriacigeorgica]|uniref:DUF3558 domain-containing protein n=1 Tax=Nocardia cyriacigeorgica TaxID=135487 RepID=A0A5R8PDQ3_9NOCA|nr:DUF3558 domain-containing protein [Nocardia cyriacigeorgica]TLG09451.1 DUF3558 domain-containing protein [Nocardia cyriacigeorgica]
MNTGTRWSAAAGVIVAALAISACNNEPTEATESGATTPQVTRPPIAVSVAPAPSQPGMAGKVAKFDSCVEVGDEAVSSLGFDPGTRRRSDYVFDRYAYIGCDFDRVEQVRAQRLAVGELTLWSTTNTLDDYRNRPDYLAKREIKINGREAFGYRLANDPACNIAMPGPDGVFVVKVSSSAALTQWVACDHIEEAARVVEAALPPVN